MIKFIREYVMKVADIIETAIGILLAVCIAVLTVYLASDLFSVFEVRGSLDAFSKYLSAAFNLVI